jgi:hypothetical protein
MTTPAEQIAEFVRLHPGEWRTGDWRADGSSSVQAAAVLPIGDGLEIAIVATEGEHVAVWALRPGGHHIGHVGDHARIEAPLLARIAARVADCVQLRGIAVADLPAWLQDETRRVLRRRAGELLTAAGFSPADVVSAAETVDEALCRRPVVEVTAALRSLMAIGMSCRWVTGANEAADDYVGFVSRRLDVVAEERDGLRAAIVQALADLDAYSEIDKGVRIATLPARANLRRVLGVT